jgi:hypothetical protein
MVEIKIDIDELNRQVSLTYQKQLPFAISKGMNAALFDTRKTIIGQMESIFHKPVPFTTNSLLVTKTTKQNFEGGIGYKEWASKGTPAFKYLQAQVYGGDRRPKKHEVALRRKGIIGAGKFTVPSKHFTDSHGNMPGPLVVKMLSGLSAFGEQGYRANIRLKKNQVSPFFVGGKNADDRSVIWYAPDGWASAKPFMFIIDSPKYTARFHFEKLVHDTFGKAFPKRFEEAMAQAIATAK